MLFTDNCERNIKNINFSMHLLSEVRNQKCEQEKFV